MCFAQSTVWYSLHTAASAAGNHLTTHLFVAFWCAPKNRQIISAVFTFFKTLRAQNTINKCKYRCRRIPMFLAPRKPKTTVFTISCATGSKNNSICSVFWALPSKNTGIEWYWHDFQQLARSTFYLQKVQKHRNLWCSSFLSATKNRTTIVQKRSKLTSWSILFIYFSGFPEEFFWGGRSAPLAMLRGREERLWTTTVDGGVTARWRLFNSPYNWGSNRPFRHFRSKVQSHELSFSIYISSGEDGHFLPQRPALYTANNSKQVSRLGFSSNLVLAAHRYVRGHGWHVSGHNSLNAAFLFFRSRNCCWLLAREVFFKTWVVLFPSIGT